MFQDKSPKMRRYRLQSQIHTICFLLATILPNFSIATTSCCPWVSPVIARNVDGDVEGPRARLSATILADGAVLEYTCIQTDNTDAELGGQNIFEHKADETTDWTLIGNGQNNPGAFDGKKTLCENHAEFLCSHVSGKVRMDGPGKAGQYRCASVRDSPQWVYWYKNEVRGSPLNVPRDKIGGPVDIVCSVPITPANKNYANMINVTWTVRNPRVRNNWQEVVATGPLFQVIFHPSGGGNVTLRNLKFQPHIYGGDYRCYITFIGTGLDILQSPVFTVTAEAKATLSHSLMDRRSSFVFGLGETVTFNCSVEAYPFVNEIDLKFMRDGEVIMNPDWIPYGDVLAISKLDYHYASISISNMTAELNGTNISCVGKRRRNDQLVAVCSAEEPIQVNLMSPTDDPKGYASPTPPKAVTKPWIVALSVIISIIVIFLLVIAAVWWCKRDDNYEDYRADIKEDGEDENLKTQGHQRPS